MSSPILLSSRPIPEFPRLSSPLCFTPQRKISLALISSRKTHYKTPVKHPLFLIAIFTLTSTSCLINNSKSNPFNWVH